MKMSKLMRSFSTRSSRYVIHKDDEADSELGQDCISNTKAYSSSGTAWLTVWRKSLVLSCHGFTVIDSNGDLVYRVDNYMGARPEEVVQMDASGHPILTLLRHKLKFKLLEESWLVYKGENRSEHCAGKSLGKPMYTVKKQMNIMGSSSRSVRVLANVYLGNNPNQKQPAYTIQGSYSHRSCKILGSSKNVVAEIKRKGMRMKGGQGVSLGLEVFALAVQPGFDQGVAMGWFCCLIKCSLNSR